MTTIKLFLNSIKWTLTNLGALVVFAILYAILLATFFRFIWIREATVWQVLLTYTFLILIPFEFFLYQAAIINRAREQKFRWRAILIDALKFFIGAIPVLLVAWLLYYLLNKIGGRFPAPITILPIAPGAPAKPPPVHWPTLLLTTLRFILMGVALPLAAIHLWIGCAGGEIRSLFASGAQPLKRVGAAFARAFSSDSVLIYALGLIIFFVLPYLILVPTFTIKGNKTEFAVFVLRLVLTFVFTLVGWVVTLSALVRLSLEESPAVAPQPIRDAPAEAAA